MQRRASGLVELRAAMLGEGRVVMSLSALGVAGIVVPVKSQQAWLERN